MPNNSAIAADTSSPPAASNSVVAAAAAVFAAPTANPIPATSAAAALTNSGLTHTNDTSQPPSPSDRDPARRIQQPRPQCIHNKTARSPATGRRDPQTASGPPTAHPPTKSEPKHQTGQPVWRHTDRTHRGAERTRTSNRGRFTCRSHTARAETKSRSSHGGAPGQTGRRV